MWSRGSRNLVLDLGSKIRSYLSKNFIFFMFHKFSGAF